MSEEIDLGDLEPAEVRYRIGGQLYVLREATAGAVASWRNAQLKAARLGPDGKPVSMGDAADSEPLLVSLCLFRLDDKGGAWPVDLKTVRSWKSRVQRPLFEKLVEISGLSREETPEGLEARMSELAEKLAKARGGDADLERKLAEIRAKAAEIGNGQAGNGHAEGNPHSGATAPTSA